MQRKTFLVRHGESADKQPGQSDFDRLLTDRGKKSVQLLGKYFSSEKISFQTLISSPATRAKDTIQLIASELLLNGINIEFNPDLYNGSDAEYLDSIYSANDILLIVGHNPSISFVIGKFTGDYSISLLPGQCAILRWNDDSTTTTAHSIQLIGPFY